MLLLIVTMLLKSWQWWLWSILSIASKDIYLQYWHILQTPCFTIHLILLDLNNTPEKDIYFHLKTSSIKSLVNRLEYL